MDWPQLSGCGWLNNAATPTFLSSLTDLEKNPAAFPSSLIRFPWLDSHFPE